MRGVWRIKKLVNGLKGHYKRWQKKHALNDTIVYWGNGASQIVPLETEQMEGITLQQNGAGTHRLVVYQRIGRLHKGDIVHAFFAHENGEFLGYQVRKKHDGVWNWLAEDGIWYTAREFAADDDKKKRLYQDGEHIGNMMQRGETLYLTAQWRNPANGDIMQDGYPVFSHKYMVHALGDYLGQTYSNTREALEDSYAKGYRYFEVDVERTTDGRLVLSHGWSENACKKTGMEYQPEFAKMTWELFMKQNIKGMHVMDAADLRDFMKEHPDTYFEIDFHRSKCKAKAKALVAAFADDMELLDRLLIQAGNRETFEDIDSVYHFKNYQVILRPEWVGKWEENIDFAFEKGIAAIAIRKAILEEDYIKVLRAAGFHVMIYTFHERNAQAERMFALGANTICIDHADCLEHEDKVG